MRESASPKVNVTVRKFTHSFVQYSTIARIEPAGFSPSDKSDIVIISAHMDSINLNNPMNGKAPGADDNGLLHILVNLLLVLSISVVINA